MKTKLLFGSALVVLIGFGALKLWQGRQSSPTQRVMEATQRSVSSEPKIVSQTAVHPTSGVRQNADAAPAWAVPYGKEFWRLSQTHANGSHQSKLNGIPSPKPLNLGEVIDRVTHAWVARSPGSLPTVQAKTYTATLDGNAVRISPDRPPNTREDRSMPPSPSAEPDVRQLAALADRTPETPEEEDALMARLTALAQEQSAAAGPSIPSQAAPMLSSQHQLLDPRLRPQPDPQTEASFQTTSIRQGDRHLFSAAADSLPWSVVGNTAQALLEPTAGVIEHLETHAQGVAVTWVFSRPLANQGAVTVEAQLTGLTYAGETAQGFHFADANGLARLRIGKATLVDAAGSSWPVPMAADGDSIKITVPDTLLAQAQYPFAIDPVISPEFGLDQPVLVAAPGAQQLPAVAANGSLFLVVWEDARNPASAVANVYGTRVKDDGTIADPNGLEITTDGGTAPAAAANGDGFLVVWEDGRDAAKNGLDIYGTRISSGGQIVDAGGIPISKADRDQLAPAASASGSDSFVVWQDGRNVETAPDIYGTLVTSKGEVALPDGIPIGVGGSIQISPAIAFNGENHLVVWAEQGQSGEFGIHGMRVSPSGTLLDPNGLPISTVAGDKLVPSVAAQGKDFLVVWEDYRNADTAFIDIYGGRVSGDGSLPDRGGFPIGTGEAFRFAPAVAAGTSDYLVVWQDLRNLAESGIDVFGARVTTAGEVSDPNGIPINTAAADQTSPALAFNGNHYLVAWTDARNAEMSDLDIYGTFVSPEAKVSDPAGMLLSTGSSDEQHPATAATASNYLVVWQDYRNALTNGVDLYGVRVGTNGEVLDLSALPICTAPGDQVLPAVAATGGTYLAVWEDYRNAGANGADIYGTRVTEAGAIQDSPAIPISTSTASELAPAVAGGPANEFFVVWQDGRNLAETGPDIYGTQVNGSGTVSTPSGVPITTTAEAQYSPALSFNGTNYLVVWADERNLGLSGVDIYGTRLSGTGDVLDSDGIPISQALGDDLSPAVASAGGSFMVVWGDARNADTTGNDIYGARISGAGDVLDSDGIPLGVAADFQALPAVAASDPSYLVVWQDGRNSSTTGVDIYGTQVNADGSVSGAAFAINTASSDQESPKLASGSPRTFLVVCQSLASGSSRAVGNLVNLDVFPVITRIDKVATSATLTWLSLSGRTYRVQYKPSLSVTGWNDLSGDVTATNSTASKADNTLNNVTNRFYRVGLLP